MKHRLVLASCLALLCLSCSACGFWSRFWLRVLLPPLPLAWCTASGWELRWQHSLGGSGRLRLPPSSQHVLAWPRQGEGWVELAAIFEASIGDGPASLPLGALVPYDLDRAGWLRPDLHGGWCLAVLKPLLARSWSPAGFNWLRLRAEAEARLPDPWWLEPSALSVALAEGRFRADYLKPPAPVLPCVVDTTGLRTAIAELAGYAGAGLLAAPASAGGQVLDLGADSPELRLPAGLWRWLLPGLELRLWLDSAGHQDWLLGA